MTTATTVQQACVNEAVQVVWQEVIKAAETGKFIGVCFDDPYSCRDAIWVSYASSRTVYTGQDSKYETHLWPHICTAFALLRNRFQMDGHSLMILETCDRRFRHHWQPDEVHLTLYFNGPGAHPDGATYVQRCLRRVDELMVRLNEPLDD